MCEVLGVAAKKLHVGAQSIFLGAPEATGLMLGSNLGSSLLT